MIDKDRIIRRANERLAETNPYRRIANLYEDAPVVHSLIEAICDEVNATSKRMWVSRNRDTFIDLGTVRAVYTEDYGPGMGGKRRFVRTGDVHATYLDEVDGTEFEKALLAYHGLE